MEAKTRGDNSGYLEALPVPSQLRIRTQLDKESNGKDQQLARYILDHWLSTHPLDGD